MQKRVGSVSLTIFLIAGFILAVTTSRAHAYIDAGSASFMIQVLVATAFGSLIALKMFWRRITGQISRFFSKVKGPRDAVE